MSTPRSKPQTGLLKLRWEDLTRGGDADYNDVVMTATGLAASSDDVLYVYEAHAQDADGNELTYRLAQAPLGAFIDPHTGVLNWAATAGCFHFVVLADDGKGGVAEQAFDLTVNTLSTDLVIKGTGGKDRIEVSERDGLVTVRVNDVARTYSHVASLRVDALGGDDEVVLRGLTMDATSTAAMATTASTPAPWRNSVWCCMEAPGTTVSRAEPATIAWTGGPATTS